ncbi:MAG TPA: hypothetical protein VHD81_04920 [Mycobacteriales bacterium]|nr:hypothetical protein [Mycobacteriales bacterium]
MCLAAVAGCGSGGSAPSTPATPSTAAYSQALQRIASQETAAQQRVADAFRKQSLPVLRKALKAFQADQTDLAGQLTALVPPQGASGPNARLAGALTDSATAIASLRVRIAHARNVTQAFYVLQSDLDSQRVGRKIGDAITLLTDLGYLPDQPSP